MPTTCSLHRPPFIYLWIFIFIGTKVTAENSNWQQRGTLRNIAMHRILHWRWTGSDWLPVTVKDCVRFDIRGLRPVPTPATIRCIWRSVTTDARRTLAAVFVANRVDYCNAVLYVAYRLEPPGDTLDCCMERTRIDTGGWTGIKIHSMDPVDVLRTLRNDDACWAIEQRRWLMKQVRHKHYLLQQLLLAVQVQLPSTMHQPRTFRSTEQDGVFLRQRFIADFWRRWLACPEYQPVSTALYG